MMVKVVLTMHIEVPYSKDGLPPNLRDLRGLFSALQLEKAAESLGYKYLDGHASIELEARNSCPVRREVG